MFIPSLRCSNNLASRRLLLLLLCLSACRTSTEAQGPCEELLDCCATLGAGVSESCTDSYDRFHDESDAKSRCAEVLTSIREIGMCASPKLGSDAGDSGLENSNLTCRDGIDNDGDGHLDCDDFDCSRNANVNVCEDAEDDDQTCDDGFDNDDDGYIDCDDFDCSRSDSVTVCQGIDDTPQITVLPIASTPGAMALVLSEVLVSAGARSSNGGYWLAGILSQTSLSFGLERAFLAKITSSGSLDSSFAQGGVQILEGANCSGFQRASVYASGSHVFASFRCGLWSVEKSSGVVALLDKEVFGYPVASDSAAVYFLVPVPSVPAAPSGVREPFLIERRMSPTSRDLQYGSVGAATANQINAKISRTLPLYVTHRPEGLVFVGATFDSGSGRAVVAQLNSSGAIELSYGSNGFAFDSQTFEKSTSIAGVTATPTSITVLVDDYDSVPVRLVAFRDANPAAPVSSLAPKVVSTAFAETIGNESVLGMRAFEDPYGHPAILIATPAAGNSYDMTTISGVRVSAGFFANGSTFVAFGNANLTTTPVATFVRGTLPN